MHLSTAAHGSGTPLICLPAFGMDKAVMATAFEPAFRATPTERIYVDLPGVGDSRHSHTDLSPADHIGATQPPSTPDPTRATELPSTSDEIVDLLAELVAPFDSFLLAGWSYGAYLAAALVRRMPSRIAGLLLVCPGVQIEGRDLPSDVVSFDQPPNARDDSYLQRLRNNGYQLSDEDTPFVYPGPAAVLTGRNDGIVGFADQFRVLASYPRATYVALADTGHMLPFEQPDAFAALTRIWLAATASPTRGAALA